MKKTLGIVFMMALVLLVAGTVFAGGQQEGGQAAGEPTEEKGSLTVGAKNFTEQYVVGNLMSLLLQEAGYDVDEKFGVSSSIARQGLTTGQTDLYADYTGTAWTVYLEHDEQINDPVELYNKVKNEDMEKNNIVWLDRFPLNNTYALAIRQEDVSKIGDSISDLGNYISKNPNDLVVGVDPEFYERPDGYFGMEKTYGFETPKKKVKTMDIGLTYDAIKNGDVDVAMVFSTDGKLKEYNLKVLEDDKQFFPVYNLCVTVRKDVLDENPEIREILKPLAQLLDDETMQTLNYRVDAEGLPAEVVATEFLKSEGLID